MTRARLEEKISSAQAELDNAISRKDYKEAGPLQGKLEQLQHLRKDYPTIDELKENVKKAEAAVANAAKSRDFANAATLQSEVDEAKKRLQEAEAVEDGYEEKQEDGNDDKNTLSISSRGYESRVDLEEEISALHERIEEAISTKDFKLASELQSNVEEKEKLRSFFPSLDELEQCLAKANENLGEAIARKDFAKAAKLHEEIANFEKKIETERIKDVQSPRSVLTASGGASVIGLDGTKVVFESRHALEKEINSKELMQENEIASKSFKKAQEIQGFIEKLQGLRGSLPTISELQVSIKNKKSDMNLAISEKRFVDAEQIDHEISTLEQKLEEEKKNSPDALSRQPNVTPVVASVYKKASGLSVHSTPIANKAITPEGRAATISGRMTNSSIQPPASISSLKQNSNDDISDVTSVRSSQSGKAKYDNAKRKAQSTKLESHIEERPVAKLRPKKPLISSVKDSVLSVTQMLASKRGDASLVVNDEGGL
jgi:cell fate (sporulation/competence/biofilm development) regulator YlbF (YheA/YmcA/DUF963 family)